MVDLMKDGQILEDDQDVLVLQKTLPATIIATLKALKTHDKLKKVFCTYRTSERQERDAQMLEKKAKPFLMDAGMSRSNAMVMIERWKLGEPTSVSDKQKVETPKKPEAGPSVAAETREKEDTRQQLPPASGKSKLKERKAAKQEQIILDGEVTALTQSSISSLEAEVNALAIRATSQESRFYTESITTASKEIDLKDVNLYVGEKQLLNDAHIRIKEGVKYGLVGRNGTGKSTLLRAMSDGLIPGLPPNVRILLVPQLGDEEMLHSLSVHASTSMTVLDAVLQGDKRRVRAEREVEALGKAMDTEDMAKVEKVVKTLWRDRIFEDLEEARRIATKRSGARGKLARKALIEAEKAYEDAKAGFVVNSENNVGNWDEEATRLHDAALLILDEVDAATAVPRAHAVLRGLGFDQEMIESPYLSLSGGWKSRCSLAAALLLSNHILLLDEPVNFLDLPSILWLEQFIGSSKETVITVAHDVEFLNRVTDELIIIKNAHLDYFDGNLADYQRTKRRQYKHAIKQQDALDRKKEMVEKSINEGMRQARKTGDDNRMRMAKSRQKKLDDRWGIERNAAGHRFKLNRDFGGYHLTSRGGVDIEDEGPEVHYLFPDPEPLPFAGSLLHVDNVTFQHKTAKKPLLRNVSMTIELGDRVGLVGPNGHGKTTLLQLIMGEKAPTSGSIEKHGRLLTAYYAQQALTAAAFDKTSSQTALQHFIENCTAAHFANDGMARAFLAQFDLKGRIVDAMPVNKLSGGQRVKLLLAEIVCCGPHLLILDEVTTHMDSDSIKACIKALRRFKGAVLLISHDRHAIKEVIEGGSSQDDGHGSESESDSSKDSVDSEDADGHHLGGVLGVTPQRKTFLVYRGRVKRLEKGVEEYIDSL